MNHPAKIRRAAKRAERVEVVLDVVPLESEEQNIAKGWWPSGAGVLVRSFLLVGAKIPHGFIFGWRAEIGRSPMLKG